MIHTWCEMMEERELVGLGFGVFLYFDFEPLDAPACFAPSVTLYVYVSCYFQYHFSP